MRAARCCITSILVLTLLGQGSGFLTAQEPPDESVLREIKEVLWPRAYAEQDTALLDSLLADEFQMVDADGNWSTKADELEWIRSNAPSYESLVFHIKRLDIFESNSAIVAGTGVITGNDEQGPYTAEYQSTNVLIKRDGAWKAVASHVSGIRRVGASEGDP